MPNKQVMKIPVEDRQNNVKTFIPLGIAKGDEPGPTLAVIAGIHASEYAAQDGVQKFWESLDPSKLRGKVMVVLAADVTALCAHHIYFNPVDEKNLNRIWPGKADGTLSEVIAHKITEEVVRKADALIDCHGGEFDESMAYYVITCKKGDPELDERTLSLAKALGVPFIEVADAYAEWLGNGTCVGEAVKSGVSAMCIEAGDRGERWVQDISAVFTSLNNALKHLDMIDGEPVPWAGKPVFLKEGIIVKSSFEGLLEPVVPLGSWIEKDAVFARIYDFDGTLLEELQAKEAGTVLTMIISRAVKAEGFVGKIGVL